jgi:capsid protein
MPANKAITEARRKNELAKLALQTAVMEQRLAIFAKYDATESSTMRRQPVREMANEDSIYDQRKRVLGTNIGRDLERNYSPARGMVHQFRMNVVGALGKIQVNTGGDEGDEAAAWFNGDWAKDCDYRDPGIHFSEQLQNVVASVLREGDALGVFDDGLIDGGSGSGKVLHWEADQIAPLSETALAVKGYKGADYSQENGIIRGKWGKVLAYVVTGKHGLSVIDAPEDATVFKAGDARLVKNPWRLNQGRGVPAMITSATNILDLYEILGKELISAKRATQIAGFVERSDAVTDYDTPATGMGHLPENSDKTASETTAEGANSAENSALNYERFEALTGGIFEYGAKGDKLVFPDINRPNVHLPEFIEAVLGYAGSSLGLARAYTILRADSSYTAFRGDMILTWAGAFYPMQKWLERQYADWVAVKALTWAQGQKLIKPLPEGWARRISWQWPRMPHVDEAREEAAVENALRNGTTDYSLLLGPAWRTKFEALAEQLDVARSSGLPLSVFSMKSGGAATPEEPKTPEQKKKENEETE